MTDHVDLFHLSGLGVPWATILRWLRQYGFPLVLQVLPVVTKGGGALTVAQIIAWVEAALAATKGGQPLPPLPTP